MARKQYHEQIIIDMPETAGATRLRPRAFFTGFEHPQTLETGIGSVMIVFTILTFSVNEDGTYLTHLPWIPTRYIKLGGADDTLISLEPGHEGAILAIKGENQMFADWLVEADRISDERETAGLGDTMLQGQYFLQVRDTEAVPVGWLIRKHAQTAMDMGHFN